MFTQSIHSRLSKTFVSPPAPAFKTTRCCRSKTRLLRVVRAEGEDVEQKAKQAEKRLASQTEQVEGQLDAIDNMTVDGDFEAKELDQNKEKMQQDLKELQNLQKELKAALKAEKES